MPDEPLPFSSPCPDDGCRGFTDSWQRDEPQHDEPTGDATTSASWSLGPRMAATGAAWLDLATGTWEESQLPIGDAVRPHAVRADSLTAPTILELTPSHPADGSYWRLDAAGEFIQFELPEIPFLDLPFSDPRLPDLRFTRIELDGNSEPALAVATRIDRPRWPDQPVAVPVAGGGFIEATIPEPLAGVTYTLIDGQLHAFGGIPYERERNADDGFTSDLVYDLDQPLLARVLQR